LSVLNSKLGRVSLTAAYVGCLIEQRRTRDFNGKEGRFCFSATYVECH